MFQCKIIFNFASKSLGLSTQKSIATITSEFFEYYIVIFYHSYKEYVMHSFAKSAYEVMFVVSKILI